ncbi:MAG: V-type ATP synthase subunit D [Acholeplasmataceae bacterium]
MNSVVNPTRMELMQLRKRLQTTRRGHKLLKDKQDEFIQQFIQIIKDYRALRIEVESQLLDVIHYYQQTSVKMLQKDINEQLAKQKSDVKLSISGYKMLGLNLPKLKVLEYKVDDEYDFLRTPAAYDQLLLHSRSLLEQLLLLAEVETKIELMISEIEKLKRRVNAIENIVIKEIEEDIHFIRMKLSDLERSNTIRMMKSKEIILSKNQKNKD